jgi:histidinol phosphatase-like PHP family hydrolase
VLPPRAVMNSISRAKENGYSPADADEFAGKDARLIKTARVYSVYQKRLKESNALDFDDIIMLTTHLFEDYPEILEKYRELGGYLITLGSDAHILSEAAANFEKAVSLLKKLGFKDVYYYKNRRPYQCKLI